MPRKAIRGKRAAAVAALVPLGIAATAGNAYASPRGHTSTRAHEQTSFTVRTVVQGASLQHSFVPAGGTAPQTEALSKPDDITRLGDHLFVGFQNGVGPQGEPSSDGNGDSTIVETSLSGDYVAQWDVAGKADGVTADPRAHLVIVTVNEDANSSLYTIDTADQQVTHYSYSEPLPHDGGTDAISIYRGQIFISASAPGTTGTAAPQATYPAVYKVSLDPMTQVATVDPLFSDEATATVANVGSPNYGQSVSLGLTDPDSSEVVPHGARFGGDFMLTSQGDQQQIFVAHAGHPNQTLSVLNLTQSVDDTAWPTGGHGVLYSTDSTNDTVDAVTGPFRRDVPVAVATPCGSNSAPATCPAPGFPDNYLATINPANGTVSAITTSGVAYSPQGGLVWVAGGRR